MRGESFHSSCVLNRHYVILLFSTKHSSCPQQKGPACWYIAGWRGGIRSVPHHCPGELGKHWFAAQPAADNSLRLKAFTAATATRGWQGFLLRFQFHFIASRVFCISLLCLCPNSFWSISWTRLSSLSFSSTLVSPNPHFLFGCSSFSHITFTISHLFSSLLDTL